MLSTKTCAAIALKQVDELDTSGNLIYEELEQVSSAITPDPLFEYIHEAHRSFAENTARDFNQSQVERIEDELRQGRQILEAKERLTRRKEFTQWKQSLSATAAEIRKRVKLVQFFGNFPVDKIVAIGSSVNIYTLCVPKFAALIDKFRELPVLAADTIKQMVKEARPPRKPKQQQEVSSTVDLKQDVAGGGRHLNFQLYDDELITKINRQVEKEQITRQQAVSIAFKRSEKLEQVQQQHVEAIAEVRDIQTQLQRESIQKDERIKDLSQQLVCAHNQIEELKGVVSTAVLDPLVVLDPAYTWESVAQLVESDRSIFLDIIKTWTVEQKETLPELLAGYVETNYPDCLDEIGWIPEKLRDAALKRISFAVQKIVGSNNLVDEPELKTFYDCKSLRDFGTRTERWLFQSKDGKQLPIFGRDEFTIEQF